jgi:mannose-6-phosphate isomerase
MPVMSPTGFSSMTLPSDSFDILCATSQYQAGLRTLQPQARYTLSTVNPTVDGSSASEANGTHAFWVLDGALSVYESEQRVATLEARQSLKKGKGASQTTTLVNECNMPVLCLEIKTGCFQSQAPIGDNANATEERPWGRFTVLQDTPRYKLKQLAVQPGSRLSLQRHQHREEHWMILAGKPYITLDDTTLHLEAGDAIRIPTHSWHRIANPLPEAGSGNEASTVEIIELQLGNYFGEDDIERREDDYGRA